MKSTSTRRAMLRAALAAVAAAGLVFSGAGIAVADTTDGAAAATASISGTVTDAATSTPVDGASVVVLDATGVQAGSATTGSSGGYTVSGLAEGAYRVSVSDAPAHDPVFWPAAASLGEAEAIDLVAEQPRTGVDVALRAVAPVPADATGDETPTASQATPAAVEESAPADAEPTAASASVSAVALAGESTGAIAGTVTRQADGSPVGDVDVWVTSASGDYGGIAVTGADGTYSVDDLDPGTYLVQFSPRSDSGLVTEYWQGQASYFAATAVPVTAGSTSAGIDASLEPAASIAGTVTREDDGAPVAGVWVYATGSATGASRLAMTDTDGTYEIVGLNADDYRVAFTAYGTGLVAEYWNGVYSSGEATPVPVVPGQAVAGVDASLIVGGTISGTITGAIPNELVSVAAARASAPDQTLSSAQVQADASGNAEYTIGSLAAGDYVVEAEPRSLTSGAYRASQFYDHAATAAQASVLTLPGSGHVGNVDFDLVDGVDVSGTVSAPSTPAGGTAIAVAYRWNGDSWSEARRITAWGEYSFTSRDGGLSPALPAGTYAIGFEADGYCTQYWDGASSLDAATSFTPAVGTTQTGIDATLSADCAANAVTPGTPTISGTATVGQTLTVQPGTWAPDPVELGYQWLADGAAIDGATAATLSLTAAQLGKSITVEVTGSRPGYTSASVVSAPAGPVTGVIAPATPTIAGSAVAGDTLTANPGSWTPSDLALAYQWSAAGAAIPAATGATFVPGESEVGKTITVTVTGSKTGYASASATSAPFGPIAAAVLDDLDPGTPTITGTPRIDESLTVDPGSWGPAPVTLTYQWLVGGEPIAGATGTTFTPDAAAVGKTVSVTVRGAKAGYNPATAEASPVGPVAAGDLTPATPTIGGTAQVGQTLTASAGAWAPEPVSIAYQWLADGAAIEGATGSSFVPDASHAGANVSVTVTGSKPGYTSQARTSEVVTVANGALVTNTPRISGTLGVGRELTVDVSAWGPAPLELGYQWLADGEPIGGATGAGFTPTAAQVGQLVSVAVTAARAGYDSETRVADAGVIPASIAASESRAVRGQEITVTGEYFLPGEQVRIELHSEPVELTTTTAGADGTFSTTVVIPADAEFRVHEIVAIGVESALEASAPIEVYDPSVAPTPAPTAGADAVGALPATGGALPIAVLVLGLALVVGGGLVVRRRTATR